MAPFVQANLASGGNSMVRIALMALLGMAANMIVGVTTLAAVSGAGFLKNHTLT